MKDAGMLLLIDDEVSRVTAIQNSFADSDKYSLEWANQLSSGLERIRRGGVEAILLKLDLPDSKGIETFERIFDAAPHVPILILIRLRDLEIAKQAVKRGAHDYVDISHVDSHFISQALSNMIHRKTTEDALFVERERAEVTLNSIGDAVLSTDIGGKVTYLNVVAEKMTGWTRERALGKPLQEVFRIIDGATRDPCPNPLEDAIQQDKTVGLRANCILVRKDGAETAIEDSAAPIRDRHGKVTGAVIVFRDVSASDAMRVQMSHLAQHDFLTDLPNRMLLEDRLTKAISLAKRHNGRLAVLFLDLDRFKNINDSLGHVIGDQVLRSVASRLAACVRHSDTVCRLGGDEFVILLTEIERAQDPAISAIKMLVTLESSHLLASHDLHVPVSIGISVYPEDGEDAETLLRNADTAMYHVKENGRNNFQFFKQEMNVFADEKRFIEENLRQAIDRNEFSLDYQPRINMETGAVTGVEALLRWRHPERGLISPEEFIPIAEESGLILHVGQWVFREACKQARKWIEAGLGPIPIAVNTSAVEFRSKEFVGSLSDILSETQLDPSYLEIELAETVLMQHIGSTFSGLEALKLLGVQLAVDDFGTGYSSLSYLSRFPIDAVKIDQSFVHMISSSTPDVPIVSAVISSGKSLNKRVIAEGVETRAQLEYLRSKGCEEAQGFFIHRPMQADKFTKLLEASMSGVLPN